MTETEAIELIDRLVKRYGKMKAVARIAAAASVPLHTAYGWVRRRSIPDWRLSKLGRLRKAA